MEEGLTRFLLKRYGKIDRFCLKFQTKRERERRRREKVKEWNKAINVIFSMYWKDLQMMGLYLISLVFLIYPYYV